MVISVLIMSGVGVAFSNNCDIKRVLCKKLLLSMQNIHR